MSRRTTINYTGDKAPLVTRAFLAIFGGFLAAFIGFSNIASAQGKWAQATPMPTARSEIVAAALDDIIYVVGGLTHQGGLTTFEAFDPATNTWMVLPPIPEPRHHTAIAALNGRIYVTGGFGRSGSGFRSHFSTVLNTTWVYEPVLRQWSEATPMPGGRAAHAMASVSGKIFVLGGVAGAPQSVWSYNPNTGTWDTTWAPIPNVREHTSAAALDGKIYVMGGRWSRGNLNVASFFDPETNTWTRLPAMPSSRGGLTAAAVNGRIHVTGGEELSGGLTFDAHEAFDPVAGTWEILAPLPTARHGLASATVNNILYAIGGATGAGLLTYTTLSDGVEAFALAPSN